MRNSEAQRINEIDRRLARNRKRYRRVYDTYARWNRERMDLDHELRKLIDERENLSQGQLILVPGELKDD